GTRRRSIRRLRSSPARGRARCSSTAGISSGRAKCFRVRPTEPVRACATGDGLTAMATAPRPEGGHTTPFRFYDNRQKYLAFVNTCNEKSVIAARCAQELRQLRPTPPAFRLFDAGMGDGTVLSRLLRTVHNYFPTVPVLAVAKEISLEDVRLGLEKMPDRFVEHPHTVLVVTNLSYANAPSLLPSNTERAAALNRHDIALAGSSAHEFGEQIEALSPIL